MRLYICYATSYMLRCDWHALNKGNLLTYLFMSVRTYVTNTSLARQDGNWDWSQNIFQCRRCIGDAASTDRIRPVSNCRTILKVVRQSSYLMAVHHVVFVSDFILSLGVIEVKMNSFTDRNWLSHSSYSRVKL